MKRIIAVLLAVSLTLSLLCVPAYATAGTDGEFTATASKETIKAGDTFDVTIALKRTTSTVVGALDFKVALSSGLEYVSHKLGDLDAYSLKSYTPANGVFTATMTATGVTKDITVLTLTIKAKDTNCGLNKVTFSDFSVGNSDGTGTLNYGSLDEVVVTTYTALTGDLPVAITKPVKGDTPETAISGTNYTGSITWNPAIAAGGKFAANTEYTAAVELTANTGYQFASDVNPTVVGSDSVTGVTVKDSGSKLEFKATFPKTNDKEAPVCAAPTGVTATFGSALSTITLTNPTGNTAGKWYWMDNTQKVGSVKDNPHTYKAKFVPNDTANFSTVENISVTVNATKVALGAGSPIMIPIDVYYTGSPIEPTPKFMTELYGDELVLGQDYEIVKYEDNTNVGTGRIFIAPLADGNYVFTGGSYKFTIKAGTSSISITGDPSKTYDGNIVTDPAVSQSGSTGAVSYTYYTDATCTTETTTANSGAASNGAAPKNAGDYWVKATLAADSNYGSATSAPKKFTISQKDLTDDMITLGTQATYDGTAHGPVYSVKDGTTVLTKGIDYTEISGYNSVTKCREYHSEDLWYGQLQGYRAEGLVSGCQGCDHHAHLRLVQDLRRD